MASTGGFTRTGLIVLVLFSLIGTSVIVMRPLSRPTFGVVFAMVLIIGVGWLLIRRSVERGDSSDGTVWDAIPAWQYEGRHIESGGLARGEQEQAIAEIEEQANQLTDHTDVPEERG